MNREYFKSQITFKKYVSIFEVEHYSSGKLILDKRRINFILKKFFAIFKDIVELWGWDEFSEKKLDHIGIKVCEDLRGSILQYYDEYYDLKIVTISPLNYFSEKELTDKFGIIMFKRFLDLAPLLKEDLEKIREFKKIINENESKPNSPNTLTEDHQKFKAYKKMFYLIKIKNEKHQNAKEKVSDEFNFSVSELQGYYSFIKLHPKDVLIWENEFRIK